MILKRAESERPILVRGKNLDAANVSAPAQVSGLRAINSQRPVETLKSVATVFEIADPEADFYLRQTQKEANGFTHLRMAQRYRGLPVVGGEMALHYDEKGNAYQADGTYVSMAGVDTQPALKSAAAVQLALDTLTSPPAGLEAAEPELVIWAMGAVPRLAYQVELRAPGYRWRVWVDAQSGDILLAYDNRHRVAAPTANGADVTISGSILSREGGNSFNVTGWREQNGLHYLYNKNRHWFIYNVASSGYSDNATYAYRNSAAWGTSDRVEMSAARNFDLTQQYFTSRHGRNSFNNAGAYARANIHYGSNYVNAYWDGEKFVFGDGDSVTAYPLDVLDVAAHEFTHAVTENTANLTYYGESGALNESFSDVFGACVEFYAQTDGRSLYPNIQAGYSDWLMGEDCWITSKSLRDMRNPRNTGTVGSDGVQPSKYHGTYWYYGSGDNGGVHYNSGVQNFFFYLLCEGGSGDNDGLAYNVTGLGIANAELVAYRALTVYCGPNTDYAAARAAWISAAQDLNAGWVTSVQDAWTAAGVGSGSSGGNDTWDPGDNTGAGATVLTLSTSEQQHGPHSLSSSDTYDWFAIYLQAGQTNIFHTQGSSGDNYGELYSDSAGLTRVAYNDDGGGDLQFYIAYTPTVSGWYYLRVRGYSVGSSLQYVLKYQRTSGSPPASSLASALDAESLTWSGGGDLAWMGESTTTHDGIDAGQSGAIGHSQTTWFETTLQGPGTLSFWWRVSSEYGYDYQSFKLNGSDVYVRSGEGAWELKTLAIPTGQQTVRWQYAKDSSVISGSDQAWVDQVNWQPGSGSGALRTFNDYNGDGISDLAVSYYNSWFIQSLNGDYLAWDVPWGFNGCVKVPGDFDGDGLYDLAVYANGLWYIRTLAGAVLAHGLKWGYPGADPVYGDYNGDGLSDLAVIDRSSGRWFIRTLSGAVLAWDAAWGFPDCDVIPGDYDGDGKYDLAVRNLANSRWYIRGVSGNIIGWDVSWGFPNTASVPGDYNADGMSDLALYSRNAHRWFIRTVAGTVLAWDAAWGYGSTPAVPGDFDGDGRSDLAIRDSSSGQWYIRTVSGSTLAWSYYWGWNGEAVPQR
jgi:Zn-dependent metalloprotease